MTSPSRLAGSLLVLAAIGTLPARSQVTPLTVPKGVLRLDFSGRFDSWDWRWRDGTREEWAADLGQMLDRSFVPGIAATEARIKRITGLGTVDLQAGRSTASAIVNLGTTGLGGSFGLTRRITVFGNVPIVSVKVAPRFLIDTTGANAAFGLDAGLQGPFFGGLALARQALAAAITGGNYDSDPAKKALAQATLARIDALQTDLVALLQADPTKSILPRSGTQIANAIEAVITELQTTLGDLGVDDLAALPAFPTGYVTPAGFNGWVADPLGPIQALPIDEVPTFSFLGDIELGATMQLIDRFPSSRIGSGFRAYGTATVRLRTSKLDSPNRFLDVGSGDRQPDVEMSLTADWVRGRLGARVSGGYNLQLAGNQNRRIARFDQPIAPITTVAGVRRNPGDIIQASVRPFFRLATYLSLFGGVDYWSKQSDKFSYAAGQAPLEGVDLADLEAGTKTDAVLLSGGLSYSHSGLSKRGALKLPLDASFRYQRIVRSGSGILPDASTFSIDLRLYARIFGRAPVPPPSTVTR